MKKTLLVTLAILFSLVSFSYALETDTHEYINEYIARNTINGFSLDSYLKDQLKIEEGIKDIFNSKYVWWWLRKGGKYEDKPPRCIPYWRSLRHFHNPLTDQGLKSTLESSIQWSQKPAETQSCGYYSWHDVRGYLLNALTSQTKTDRDKNFAETFRGLGQLMHLVQDLSVPAHTRDDIHLIYNYETWALENLNYEKISGYDPIPFDPSAIGNPNPLASVPIANLFDTNQYVEPNPDPSITLRADIGLSEYTNANFFSNGTIYGTILSGNFPYPNWSSVQTEDYEIQDPRNPSNMVFRKYYKKVSHGDTGYRLVTVPILIAYNYHTGELGRYEPPVLDEYVYNDYAERLIPRAVGYSAGLLDYFFRGKIDLITNPDNPDGYVIENKTEEEMDGTFELYYDDINDVRKEIENGDFPLTTAIPANEKSNNVTFTPPDDAKEPCKYILVFNGKLGNEEGAVVGKVVGVKACGFRFKLTRGDDAVVDSSLLTLLIVKNSHGAQLDVTYEYDAATEYWNVALNNPGDLDPGGHWVLYCCKDGITTQYPYRYKTADKNQDVDLINPGIYEDIIPYWKVKGIFISIPDGGFFWHCDPFPVPGDYCMCDIAPNRALALRPGGSCLQKKLNVKSSVPYKITRKLDFSHYLYVHTAAYWCLPGVGTHCAVVHWEWYDGVGFLCENISGNAGWGDGLEGSPATVQLRVHGGSLNEVIDYYSVADVYVSDTIDSPDVAGKMHGITFENVTSSERDFICSDETSECSYGEALTYSQNFAIYDKRIPSIGATYNY